MLLSDALYQRYRVAKCQKKKQDPSIHCLQEAHFRLSKDIRAKSGRMGKDFMQWKKLTKSWGSTSFIRQNRL